MSPGIGIVTVGMETIFSTSSCKTCLKVSSLLYIHDVFYFIVLYLLWFVCKVIGKQPEHCLNRSADSI